MADAADRLLSQVGHRQYVLTIPKRLRWFVNQNVALPGELSRILAREIELLLRQRTAGSAAAQIHFIQRAGRSLNLHPHVHAVVSEGRFSLEQGLLGPRLKFHAAAAPSQRDIELMTESLRRKILRRLRRLCAIPADLAQKMLAWPNSGFSLHAKVFVPAGDREGLERLLHYCAKPGLSPMRLSDCRPDKPVSDKQNRRYREQPSRPGPRGGLASAIIPYRRRSEPLDWTGVVRLAASR
jgi:hypothetical protein